MIDILVIALFQAVAGEPAIPGEVPTDPPAAAETEGATTVEQVEVPAPPPPVVRCRMERETGSRMSVRVCRTVEAQEFYDENNEQSRDRLRRVTPNNTAPPAPRG